MDATNYNSLPTLKLPKSYRTRPRAAKIGHRRNVLVRVERQQIDDVRVR
jgi:hypothetical protein